MSTEHKFTMMLSGDAVKITKLKTLPNVGQVVFASGGFSTRTLCIESVIDILNGFASDLKTVTGSPYIVVTKGEELHLADLDIFKEKNVIKSDIVATVIASRSSDAVYQV